MPESAEQPEPPIGVALVEGCDVEWDDRDDPDLPYGSGYSCEQAWEHPGPHRCGDFTWEK